MARSASDRVVASLAFDGQGLAIPELSQERLAYAASRDPSVVGTIKVGQDPYDLVFDSINSYVYVASYNSVSVISGNSVVGTVTVPSCAVPQIACDLLAFDAAHNYIYVANYDSTLVTVISGISVVGTIDIGGVAASGRSIAFNPSNNETYVTSFVGTLSVISGVNLVKTIALGNCSLNPPSACPTEIAYNPSNGAMYVVNAISDTVSVISGTSIIGTLQLHSSPSQIAFDPVDKEMYVTSNNSTELSVLSGTAIVGTVDVGATQVVSRLVFNPSSGYMYVITDAGCPPCSPVKLISGTTVAGTIPFNWPIDINTGGFSMAFNPTDNSMYVLADLLNGTSAAGAVMITSGSKVTGSVRVGDRPGALAFDPSNNNMYVVNLDSNTVSVIGIGKTNSQLYVTEFQSGNATVIDDVSNNVIANITVGPAPRGITYDAESQKLYVANTGVGTTPGHTVSVIDTRTGILTNSIQVGLGPIGLAFDPINDRVYVTNSVSQTVSVINGATDGVVSTISVGSFPDAAAYCESNGRLYVTNGGSGTISVIDPNTETVVATISVGSNPTAVICNPVNDQIYAVNGNSGTVSVINGTINAMVQTVSVGSFPNGIAVDTSNREIYVSNSSPGGAGTVSVIDSNNNQVIKTITVGAYPLGIVYDPASRYVYVANSVSNTVSIIDSISDTVITTVKLCCTPTYVALVPSTFNLPPSCITGDQNDRFATLGLNYGSLSPNLWNIGSGTGQVQMCTRPSGISTSIHLSQLAYGKSGGTPLGYPRIGYGRNLQDQEFGTLDNPLTFPTHISDFTGQNYLANATYSLGAVSPAGLPVDLAYDLWLRSYECNPAPCATTSSDYEILIALYDSYQLSNSLARPFNDQIYLNGHQTQASWTVYVGGGGANATLVTFVLNQPTQQLAGNIAVNLGDFISQLETIENKDLSNYYLMGIELGTEFGNTSYNTASWNWTVSNLEIDNPCARIHIIPSGITTTPITSCLTPTRGTGYGNTFVTITGTGFTGATEVDFGTAKATGLQLLSDSEIVAVSPPGSSSVDVTVTTSLGTSKTTNSDVFTYVSSTGFSPTEGPYSGSTLVTITGNDFTSPAQVWFGNTPATQVTLLSPNTITAVSPPGSGTVTVVVADNSVGNIPVSGPDTFNYLPFNIAGNITFQQITNYQVLSNASNGTYTIQFTVTGPTGTTGVANITIPGSNVPAGLIPSIYIDGVLSSQQSYSYATNNYYVYFKVHFSTHTVTIRFQTPTEQTPPNKPFRLNLTTAAIVIVAVVAIATGSTITLRRRRRQGVPLTPIKT